MNKRAVSLLLIGFLSFLTSCTAITTPVTNQYRLEGYSAKVLAHSKSSSTILVSLPEALAGSQTEEMQYIEKPFELNSFAHNAWVSPPANMLYPLILESLQKTNYFNAVASGPYVDKADYRLDTQLVKLLQNYLVKPSVIELTVKTTLTHIPDNRVVTSRIFHQRVPCPFNTPYGGVLAANRASIAFTREMSQFVVQEVQRDHKK